MKKNKIRVLIIDDSALVRNILKKGLSMDPDLEIIGTAIDAYSARNKIVLDNPDVITLDIEMPKMDGITFLKYLMPQNPIPTVMVSSMTFEGSNATMDALENGAVDFVLKPSIAINKGLNEMIDELITKIKIASRADVSRWKDPEFQNKLKSRTIITKNKILNDSSDKVIAIGASTGGVVTLTEIITSLPYELPGIVIVQHMPPVFTKLFAERLNKKSKLIVKEAEDGDKIFNGRVLIAPGDKHIRVIRSGGNYIVKCTDEDKVNGHKPSVEILFNSVAENAGANAIGIMLTGMGKDGAMAMLNMRKNGARTIAQDKESSIVFGMPHQAFICGGAEELVNLKDIPHKILTLAGCILNK